MMSSAEIDAAAAGTQAKKRTIVIDAVSDTV